MSKEFQGFTNKVVLNDDGSVTKAFEDNGLTERLAKFRQSAEVYSLKTVSSSPDFICEEGNLVTMTRLPGENDLNSKIRELSEGEKVTLFESAGKTLRMIHEIEKTSMPSVYHFQVIEASLLRVKSLEEALVGVGVDAQSLINYFVNAYSQDAVDKQGVALTHGDYWLNNLIARHGKSVFEVSGVIDWEMARLGSPYLDFALVELSMESSHPVSKETFWRGYDDAPDESMKRYFSIRQIIEWMNGDLNADFKSDFYKEKIDLVKKTI